MVTYVCKSCGYTTKEENAKFCQTCGSALEMVRGENCPKCNTPITPEAQFCSKCGAALGASAVPPAATTPQVHPQQQTNVMGAPRDVTGPILKLMPLASFIDRGIKVTGAIQLRRDGLRFAALNGEKINCPLEEVAAVFQGQKTDNMEVQMKNGKIYSFHVMGGRKWIEAFNAILK